MKTRIQRTRYANTNRIRSICFAFLLIFGVGLVFSSGVQAALIYNLPSVPIIIYNYAGDSSSWTITTAASNNYVFGYDNTTLLTGSDLTTWTFDNGVYDFWLDIGNDELYLSEGDATLTFQGTGFTAADGTTYYASFFINWDIPGLGRFDFTFASVNDLNAGAAPVPIPASVLLLGSGVLGLIVIGRVRKTKQLTKQIPSHS